MKRIFSSIILTLGITTGFIACGDDSSSTAANEKKEVIKDNDLEEIQKLLADATAMDPADSFIRSTPAIDLNDAKVAYLYFTADSSRLTTAKDGSMEFRMTDEYGTTQGLCLFTPVMDSTTGIIAQMTFSELEKKPKVTTLQFVDEFVLPDNNSWEPVLQCSHSKDIEKFRNECNGSQDGCKKFNSHCKNYDKATSKVPAVDRDCIRVCKSNGYPIEI